MTKELLCTACGNVGKPKRTAKGSMAIELVLWLFFIIPGLIYSLWRMANKQQVCRVCGNTSLIPLDSPIAQRMIANKETSTIS